MARVTLPIACAISSNYVLPLLVMLNSLQEHLRPSYRLTLYLVHQGVREDLLAIISRLVETHSIVLGPENPATLLRDPHFPPEAAYPLLLPELLPAAMDRILFLDADILVLADLAELWETPIGEHVLAAVRDEAIPFCCSPRGVKKCKDSGISKDAAYFNCGVMLIDMFKWRKREVTRHASGYLKSVGRQVDFLHQEALNAILWNDWHPLDGRWNLLGSLSGRTYHRTESNSWRNPGIVHFAGRFKPWRFRTGGPFDQQYDMYLSRAAQLVPAVRPTLRGKLLSLYDRHLRNSFYECERALWNRGLI
jgi:lipopolysaccharide biosynthesis glycosyltransferase